jgi:hypothetical protein
MHVRTPAPHKPFSVTMMGSMAPERMLMGMEMLNCAGGVAITWP